jgi:hypothetical protein
MKGFACFLVSGMVFALSACVNAPMDSSDDQVSTSQAKIEMVPEPTPGRPVVIQPFPVISPNTSTWWDPSQFTYANLWPLGHGITSAQIMFRQAADCSTGRTYVAFVVWNGNFLGRIYRIHIGDSASFSAAVAQLTDGRASASPDYSVSSTGNSTSGGTKPPPHPNVDGQITYSGDDLTNVRSVATSLLNVTTPFRNYIEIQNIELPGVP